jgi:NRPS condensation-like uncharacterized protein
MALMCVSDNGYDPSSNPIPFKNLTIMQRGGMIIAGLVSFPYALYKNTANNDKPNPLNNKAHVSGIRKNAVSKDFSLESIKMAAKKNNVSINDYVTAALGITIKKYFEKYKFNHTSAVTLVFPINIRYNLP